MNDEQVKHLVVDAVCEFTTSDTTAALDAALAKAQGEITSASKDKINPHFKSKYADLSDVWNACRLALSKNGISVTQWPLHSVDGKVHLLTRLACSGEWMKCHFSVPAPKQDAQGFGSSITYIRRFALAAAVGVAAEDDDVNAATEFTPKQTTKAPQSKAEMVQALTDSLAFAKEVREAVDRAPDVAGLEAIWTQYTDTQSKLAVARPIFAERKAAFIEAAKKAVKQTLGEAS